MINNESNLANGGKAKLQVYQNDSSEISDDSDSDSECEKPSKKSRRRLQPMVISICTPLTYVSRTSKCSAGR